MTVDELKGMTNEKILFSTFKETLLIRSLVYRYADFIKLDAIESIEKISESQIRVNVPNGSSMGDHVIVADIETGVVVADGKTFDELIPEDVKSSSQQKIQTTARKPSVRFTPTINGFSIGSVKTMPSTDGYAVSCKVYFNGVKIGDFVDRGDGGEYLFYADKPYSTEKIEKVIRSFPPTVRDYGYGPIEVVYDMNQMVNELMEMKDISKELIKLEPDGKDYVLIDEWKTNRHLTAIPSKTMTDEELEVKLREELGKMGLTEYEVRRYRRLDDLHMLNTFVCQEVLL